MDFVRTPEERFENLPDYPFAPNYVHVDDGEGSSLRMHYVDEGQGEAILCLHGQPTWSYLYRKMIPVMAGAGYRVIAPDLIGFGKSDKPTAQDSYSYSRHVHWVKGLIDALDLAAITMFAQDWGGAIGLRLVAENPDRFARVVVANTGLGDAAEFPDEMAPRLKELLAQTPVLPMMEMAAKMMNPKGPFANVEDDRPPFMYWMKHSQASPEFDPAVVVRASLKHCTDEEYAAWEAPFPSEEYMAGARVFPSLAPIIPDNPEIPANRAAWSVLSNFEKPFLTAFSDGDPATRGGEKRFIETVPGARGQKHTVIEGAGHFLQDDAGAELAAVVVNFMRDNPVS